MSKLKFMDQPVRSSAGGDRPARTDARSDDRKWYPDHAVLIGAGNRDQIKSMPEFKFD